MSNQALKDLLNWIEIQIKNNPYAEVSLKFSVHDGKVKRIERGLIQKLQEA